MNYIDKKYPVGVGSVVFAMTNDIRYQFRLIANLDKDIDAKILQRAVDLVVPRFPMYSIVLNKKYNSIRQCVVKSMPVKIEQFYVQQHPFDLYSGKPLYRIFYDKRLVCVEMFHILSDANGGLAFLNSLLACYFSLLGEDVDMTNIIDINSQVEEEEFEDAYLRFAKKAKSKVNVLQSLFDKKFAIKDKPLPNRNCIVNTYTFDITCLKDIAKKYNATLHEYLMAIICLAFDKIRQELGSKKCIRIQTPIDLRRKFPSKTRHNFVGTTQFSTQLTQKTQLIESIKKYYQFVTSDQELNAFLYQAVQLMHKTLPIFPRFIGDILLKIGDNLVAEKMSNTSFSNLGVNNVNLAKNGVKSFEFILGTPKYAPFMLSCLSFDKTMNFTINRHIQSDKFDKYFLQELAKDGIIPQNCTTRQ